jgi:hypothetical protein
MYGYAYGVDSVLDNIWLHHVCYDPRVPFCGHVILQGSTIEQQLCRLVEYNAAT